MVSDAMKWPKNIVPFEFDSSISEFRFSNNLTIILKWSFISYYKVMQVRLLINNVLTKYDYLSKNHTLPNYHRVVFKSIPGLYFKMKRLNIFFQIKNKYK